MSGVAPNNGRLYMARMARPAENLGILVNLVPPRCLKVVCSSVSLCLVLEVAKPVMLHSTLLPRLKELQHLQKSKNVVSLVPYWGPFRAHEYAACVQRMENDTMLCRTRPPESGGSFDAHTLMNPSVE
jgi:hypothetical protein